MLNLLSNGLCSFFRRTEPGKIAVYTAIIGDYDDCPEVRNPDPSLQYYLFTDQKSMQQKPPWTVFPIRRVMHDPILEAKRIKILPHIYLPSFDQSVWIDGNFTLKRLTSRFIKRNLAGVDLALPVHPDRNCIYEEAKAVLEMRIESRDNVLRQLNHYRDEGFPDEFGLHASGFLLRNHHSEGCKVLARNWWKWMMKDKKRDQLSFDYFRWKLAIKVRSLPIDIRNNPVFDWGRDKQGLHKVPHQKVMSA